MSAELKENYFIQDLPKGYFDLIPQEAIRAQKVPSNTKHNAAWDFMLCRDKRTVYFPICGELSQPLSAKLYRYDCRTGELTLCFSLDREFFVSPRETPPSKIHTSLCEMEDGRILMTTHTTSRSPSHPYWLFEAYYEHAYEGYPGSHVLIYDPHDGSVKNLGIPVKRDSIYGAVYDAKHNAYFFTTFLRGELYRIDLDTLELKDLGQITEFGSFCLFLDGRGGVITSSRTGHVFRIDTETLAIRDLGLVGSEPEDSYRWSVHRVIAHHAKGPDNAIWFTMHYSEKIYRLDLDTFAITERPLGIHGEWEKAPPLMEKGHVFDSQGILWYFESREAANKHAGGALHLFRRDILHGGKPEFMGMVGVPGHGCAILSECDIDDQDVVHFPDGNHCQDMAWIISIDLRKVAAHAGDPRIVCRDPFVYSPFADGAKFYPGEDFAKDTEQYNRFREYCRNDAQFRVRYANVVVKYRAAAIGRVWEEMPFDEEHTVHEVHFTDETHVSCRCGEQGRYRFTLGLEGLSEPELCTEPLAVPELELPPNLELSSLPARCGRRWLAEQISAAVPMADGRWLIASKDAVFSLFDPATQNVFALGAIGAHGPVTLAVSGDRQVAYGLSGDPDDLTHLLRYDNQRGLVDLGRPIRTNVVTNITGAKDPTANLVIPRNRKAPDLVVAANAQYSSIAVNHDGSACAVGGAGRLATCFLFFF